MTADVSFIALIFGELQCSAIFNCDPTHFGKFDSYGGILLWFAVCLYMFKQLGVICDEYFVPSLEVIVEKLEMSNDVAGATFMAAGSSAPELFTSLVATFIIVNEGGVGTIVGSAIFNVAVIVGATGWVAGKDDPLKIWWYPLTRDCIFYLISIGELAIVLYDGKVRWYESLIMVITYLFYILFMWCNPLVIRYLNLDVDEEEASDQATDEKIPSKDATVEEGHVTHDPVTEFSQTVAMPVTICSATPASDAANRGAPPIFIKPMQDPVPGMVAANSGGSAHSAHLEVHAQEPDHKPKHTLSAPGGSDEGPDMEESEPNSSPRTSLSSFNGEEHGLHQHAHPHHKDHKHAKHSHKVRMRLMATQKHDVGRQNSKEKHALHNALPVIPSACSTGGPPEEEDRSDQVVEILDIPKRQRSKEEEEAKPVSEPVPNMLTSIRKACSDLCSRIPDPCAWAMDKFMPSPERHHWLLFTLSIAAIAVATYVMVDSVNRSGTILKVPPFVMGMTVLAAGTSIPDMMGSIAVAKQGEGDMAVANALGSNIFDILIGLGVPWLTKSAMGKEVDFGDQFDIIGPDIGILAGILFVFIAALLLNRWRLSRRLGLFLLSLYVTNVIYNIFAVYVFKSKPVED